MELQMSMTYSCYLQPLARTAERKAIAGFGREKKNESGNAPRRLFAELFALLGVIS